ncbi:C1 family peptidase [Symmachiella dynata]|uniref:C1 family peptidase n=1 Tax=Symmachiella dynata TaxID=2527995 RepID=UPI0018D28736|nr:C1 family peptidase [Symmachiella dynata]
MLINCDSVPGILDQGNEGACTGFALAAVINFLLMRRNRRRFVSCRMLYEMARRYDEWPGEQYEGSSARGAMKGWVSHGVCSSDSWPDDLRGHDNLNGDRAEEAQHTPGGAYFRVDHRQVRDVHAALAEVGIVYATLMVHSGWGDPGPVTRSITYVENGNLRTREFPVITRQGRADSGHAVAIVGYTADGFVIQNSWGTSWGVNGFALLPYEDYMLHVTDIWVAQLGVPVSMNLWEQYGATDSTAGLHRATPTVPMSDIRPFVVDLGNNGGLSDSGNYWTTEADIKRLFDEEIPRRAAEWDKLRILFYLHGGLNGEAETARRIVAFKDVLLENEIYPIHIMWESGLRETVYGILEDLFTDTDERAAGPAEWLKRFRDGLLEARDRTLELTAALPGSLFWSEMKENARLASHHPDGRGGMQILSKHVKDVVADAVRDKSRKIELHVVAHSAGSIFAAHAIDLILNSKVPFKSFHLMAPAIRADQFKSLVLPKIKSGKCPHPTLYVLSDSGERDDTVGPYGKSLLYLVSNAFEGEFGTPLLGMERFVSETTNGDAEDVDEDLARLFSRPVDEKPSLIVAGKAGDESSVSRSDSHGGFDNDPATMNSILRRILKNIPNREFTVRDLQF